MCNIKTKFSIKEVVNKINQKFDKFERKLDNLSEKIKDIDLRLTKVETKLDSELLASKEENKKIQGSQKAQIWTLIGGLITAVVGFLSVVVRLISLNL